MMRLCKNDRVVSFHRYRMSDWPRGKSWGILERTTILPDTMLPEPPPQPVVLPLELWERIFLRLSPVQIVALRAVLFPSQLSGGDAHRLTWSTSR